MHIPKNVSCQNILNMKHLKLLLVTLLFYSTVAAQNSVDTVYLDSNWEKTESVDYKYFRVLTRTPDGNYVCKDFWKSGEIQMEGILSELYPSTREGQYKWYNKNGTIRQVCDYRNNYIVGTIKKYDSNGIFDLEHVPMTDSLDDADELTAAIKQFHIFTSKKIRYPKNAIIDEIEGRVVISFYVDQTGSAYRLSVTESVNEEVDNEAKRIVSLYKWPVPMFHKKPAMVLFALPVNFLLD